MKIWLKKYWWPLLMIVVGIINLLMWTPFNCFIAGVLLMCTLNELDK